MAQKLFLSYKREDNADGFVEKLYHALIDKGYDVWWDMMSMPNRQLNFLTEIRDAIAKHDRLILVGSKLAYKSDYVKAEYDYALSVCKPVHLVLRADEYGDVPERISQLDAPNFKDKDFDYALEHLCRHLEQDSAPLGELHGTRPALPPWYIERDNIMGELENKVLIDSKLPVVVTSKQQVSALHGMGGIGKTTVASAFSKRCATRRYFTDGIFWLSLGKNPEITARQADIGYIFGDDRKEYLSPEIGLNRLQNILANKKILLILDDVWEKQHAEAFRVTGNFNRVLMTSRSRRLVTQSTGKDQSVLLDSLSIDEGIRLFDERLNRTAEDERPHDAIERQIVNLLDGYTLAIALASAKLLENGADYAPRLLERLQKRQESDNPFRSLKLDDENKQENIEVSLSLSYDDLSDDEQARFRKLGVLAPNEPFTLDLMQSLWRDEDDEDSEDALEKLLNMALINRDDNGLYEQHTVLRAYAIALLKRENEYDTHYHAYLNHITELGKQFYQLKLEKWRTLDDIIPHVLYVGDTLAETYENDEKLADIAYEFAYNTKSYVYRRLEMKRQPWLEMGLALAQENENAGRQAFFLNSIGYIYDVLGEKDKALTYYNQALPLYRQVGDKSGEATTLNNLGMVYRSLGQMQEALAYYNQALPMHRQVGNKSMEAMTLNNIGAVYNALGEKQEALAYYNQALPLRKEVGDKSGEATTLNNMGMIYSALGEKQKALAYYNQALPMHRQVGNKSSEATTLNNIGRVYDALGEKQEALAYYNQALPMHRQVGNKSSEATTLNNIGAVYNALGEKQEALKFYNQALPMLREVGNKSVEASTLNNIGEGYRSLGQMQEALAYFNQALPLFKEVGYKSGEATTLTNIGAVYSSLGEKDEALAYFNQALPIVQQIGDTFNEFVFLAHIAVIYRQEGNLDEAIITLSQSVALGEKIGHPNTEAYRQHLINLRKERDNGA